MVFILFASFLVFPAKRRKETFSSAGLYLAYEEQGIKEIGLSSYLGACFKQQERNLWRRSYCIFVEAPISICKDGRGCEFPRLELCFAYGEKEKPYMVFSAL